MFVKRLFSGPALCGHVAKAWHKVGSIVNHYPACSATTSNADQIHLRNHDDNSMASITDTLEATGRRDWLSEKQALPETNPANHPIHRKYGRTLSTIREVAESVIEGGAATRASTMSRIVRKAYEYQLVKTARQIPSWIHEVHPWIDNFVNNPEVRSQYTDADYLRSLGSLSAFVPKPDPTQARLAEEASCASSEMVQPYVEYSTQRYGYKDRESDRALTSQSLSKWQQIRQRRVSPETSNPKLSPRADGITANTQEIQNRHGGTHIQNPQDVSSRNDGGDNTALRVTNNKPKNGKSASIHHIEQLPDGVDRGRSSVNASLHEHPRGKMLTKIFTSKILRHILLSNTAE